MSRLVIDRTPIMGENKTYDIDPSFFRYDGGDIARRSDITAQEYKGEWYEIEHYVFELDTTIRIMVPASAVENNPAVFRVME